MTATQVNMDIPKHIGHYRLIGKIGQGGMSIVYEAVDEHLKRKIALKVLHPFLAESLEYKSRFFREAQAVAQLSHPNIVQIFDLARPNNGDEYLYIATELIHGLTLKEWTLKEVRQKDLPELSAMIIMQVLQALKHAHEKGIIHRDIKPENIMLSQSGLIKLMDFGIASISSEESMTQAGTLLGSLAFLAPEIIAGQKASVRSDIYSVATVFYWLCAGRLPFNGDTPHSLLKAISEQKADLPQRHSATISDSLSSIIQRGMHKDEKMRFESAEEMIVALEKALKEMGISINNKKLNLVLSGQQSLNDFEEEIFTQIKEQEKKLIANNSEAKALVLRIRLGRHDRANLLANETKELKFWPLVLAVALVPVAIGHDLILVPIKQVQDSAQAVEQLSAKEELGDYSLKPVAFLASLDEEAFLNSPKPEPEEKIVEEAEKKEEVLLEQPKKPEVIGLQKISLIIWPFADVYLDGQIIAKAKKSLELELKPGAYRLSFTHPFAATVEKLLKIERVEPRVELAVKMLKSKPAFLVVQSPVDANVAVGGSFKGTSDLSRSKPIVIPLPDKTHAFYEKVLIQKDGFQPFIETVEFVAGQIKIIRPELEPVPR